MATLNVDTTTDFSGQTLDDVISIVFTNTASAATATFGADQFDDVQISSAVKITGSAAVNRIVVRGGIDASDWTFASWGSNDTIAILGGAVSIWSSVQPSATPSPAPAEMTAFPAAGFQCGTASRAGVSLRSSN